MMPPIADTAGPVDDGVDRINAALGDGRVICTTCGATLVTYGQRCTSDLDVACHGFLSIEAARRGMAVVEIVGTCT